MWLSARLIIPPPTVRPNTLGLTLSGEVYDPDVASLTVASHCSTAEYQLAHTVAHKQSTSLCGLTPTLEPAEGKQHPRTTRQSSLHS